MTKSHSELVSVIIPTRNRKELLERAIHSVLNQTYSPIEIIVVSDGSTDGTATLVSSLQKTYPQIKYFKHGHSKGAPKARNHGIREASGKFVTFLDDDDEFLADNIEECMKSYNDDYAYICTGYRRITPRGSTDVLPKKIITYDAMLYKIVTGNQILARKDRIMELGGFDETLLSSQDYDLWLRLNQKYGDANCARNPLIIMHAEHDYDRITTSKSKIKGEIEFYNKHKQEMTSKQRKYQLFYIMKLKRKKITLLRFLSYVPIRFLWPDIKYYLLVNYPALSKTNIS